MGVRRNKQGKLVIGSFQNSPRQPYQYPPQQQQSQQSSQPQQPTVPAGYPQRGPVPPGQQGYVAQSAPAATPAIQGYPFKQPGQPGPNHQPDQRSLRRRPGCMIGCLAALFLAIVIVGFSAYTAQQVLAFGSAISTQAPLSTQTGYMSTPNRVNILVMGYGGGSHQGANLTDSLIVMSLMPQRHHTTLISVPRDLWIQYPPTSGNYYKINAVYPIASKNNANPVAGGDAAAQKVSLVTGLNIKYWMTINFTGFRDFINAIGGVDVDVPDAFTSNYPKNDDPSIDASWTKVHFAKGLQHMNGATAIEYARARYVIDNPAEGTDFARSARQQLIMKAALSRLKDWHTWPSFFSAMDALKHTIYTNLSLADLAQFALKMDLNNAHRVGLNFSSVSVGARSNDGQSILLPRNDDWQAIKDYISQQLYN